MYGETKYQAEQLICKTGCKYIILRTSSIYYIRGSSFIKNVLRLSGEREELNVVPDQYGEPTTSAKLIAKISAIILHDVSQGKYSGLEVFRVYHLAASGKT
jgi:dTDP-4-dehydrorhamnose reductase